MFAVWFKGHCSTRTPLARNSKLILDLIRHRVSFGTCFLKRASHKPLNAVYTCNHAQRDFSQNECESVFNYNFILLCVVVLWKQASYNFVKRCIYIYSKYTVNFICQNLVKSYKIIFFILKKSSAEHSVRIQEIIIFFGELVCSLRTTWDATWPSRPLFASVLWTVETLSLPLSVNGRVTWSYYLHPWHKPFPFCTDSSWTYICNWIYFVFLFVLFSVGILHIY